MTQGQTDTLKKAFLKAFRDCGSVTAAATIAGLRTRKEHYRWLEIDQQYCADFAEAEEVALEARLRERREALNDPRTN